MTTRAVLTVSWPARSRGNVSSLSSALSAQVTLARAASADDGSPALTFTVNRRSSPAAYTETYTAPRDLVVGEWDVRVRFFAHPDAGGDVVGVADAHVALTTDGQLPDIATAGLIRSVTVVPGQSVLAGGTSQDLLFTAYRDDGTVLAVTPGSAFFAVTNGADKLQLTETGQAQGLLPGTASVTATVDGIISPATIVRVISNAVVIITPSPAQLSVGAEQTFSAAVANAPDARVTWAVQEGDAGGVITPEGRYTAPGTPGVYHVVATSVYDPSKQAVVTVTVQAGGASVGVDFPPTGGLQVGID